MFYPNFAMKPVIRMSLVSALFRKSIVYPSLFYIFSWWWWVNRPGDHDELVKIKERKEEFSMNPDVGLDVDDDGSNEKPVLEFAQAKASPEINFSQSFSKELLDHAPKQLPYHPPPAPKAMSDMVEALIGAVFVDSGFDIEKTWLVVDRLLYLQSYFSDDDQVMEESRVCGEVTDQPIVLTAWKPMERWVSEDYGDALLGRVHPIRKLSEWIEGRQCRGFYLW
jgi:hypothetical protein